MFALTVKPGHLSLAELRRAYHEPVQIKLEDQAYAAIDRSVACVNRIVEENRTVYGINTGFGLLASTRIAREDLEKLQRSIVLSHAAGVGEAVDDATVRLIMLLKINSLARGFSGVRRIVLEHLMALVNAEGAEHQDNQFQFISLAQQSETGERPHASVVFSNAGREIKASSEGNGPVDASFKAIESEVQSGAEMVLYSVNAISGSTEISSATRVTGRPMAGRTISAANVAPPPTPATPAELTVTMPTSVAIHSGSKVSMPTAGATITVQNESGLKRSVPVDANGRYNLISAAQNIAKLYQMNMR